MKFTIDAAEFADALGVATRAVSTRANIAVLQAVRVDVRKAAIDIVGTDMSRIIVATAEPITDAKKKGSFLIGNARTVLTGLKTLEGDVTVTAGAEEVEFVCGPTTLTYPSWPMIDFPKLDLETDPIASIPYDELAAAFGAINCARSQDASRPMLCGVELDFQKDAVTLAATDSYRLSWSRASSARTGGNVAVVVEGGTLAEAIKLLKGAETVDVGYRGNFVAFSAGLVTVFGRKIDGTFPNWRQLIPSGFDNEITLDRVAAYKAAKRIGKLARTGVPLRVHFSPDEILFTLEAREEGSIKEVVPGEADATMLLGMSAPFLADGLATFDSDEVQLQVISGIRPFVIHDGDLDDRGYLLMPIRLPEHA